MKTFETNFTLTLILFSDVHMSDFLNENFLITVFKLRFSLFIIRSVQWHLHME